MGRRTILLIVAALIAALGSAMVFLYVRGADDRATEAQAPVQVLKAVAQINPGETLDQAQAAGKIELGTVPRAQVLPGAVNSIEGIGAQVALSSIFPNEQIIAGKFGAQDGAVLALIEGLRMGMGLLDRTMPASVRQARLAGWSRRRRSIGLRRRGCATRSFTPPRCVRPRVRRAAPNWRGRSRIGLRRRRGRNRGGCGSSSQGWK